MKNNDEWNGKDYMLSWMGFGLCIFLILIGIGGCGHLIDGVNH